MPFAVLQKCFHCCLSTCCPNVHTAGYSNKHTASQAHCFSFQSLYFPPVRALPPPLLQHSTLTHLVLHTLLSYDGLLHFLQIPWFWIILEICCLLPTPLGVFVKVKQIWKQSGLSHYSFFLPSFCFHSPKGPFD